MDSIGNMSIKKIKILTDSNNDSTFVYILCRTANILYKIHYVANINYERFYFMNKIYNVNDIVKVIETDMVGKIIDVKVNGQNTLYLIVFDNGTFDSFLGKEIILN